MDCQGGHNYFNDCWMKGYHVIYGEESRCTSIDIQSGYPKSFDIFENGAGFCTVRCFVFFKFRIYPFTYQV